MIRSHVLICGGTGCTSSGSMAVRSALETELEKQGLVELYEQIEEPMIQVLADMEMAGVKIDCEELARYAVELNAELNGLERAVREEAG